MGRTRHSCHVWPSRHDSVVFVCLRWCVLIRCEIGSKARLGLLSNIAAHAIEWTVYLPPPAEPTLHPHPKRQVSQTKASARMLKVPLDATSLPPVPLEGLPAVEITPFLPQNDVGRMPSTSTVPEAARLGSTSKPRGLALKASKAVV